MDTETYSRATVAKRLLAEATALCLMLSCGKVSSRAAAVIFTLTILTVVQVKTNQRKGRSVLPHLS